MSTVTVIVKGIQGKYKADFWVWLDKFLGDFAQVEINPDTYLITTGNIKCAESLCSERNISIACNDVIFVNIAASAIQDIGLTEAEYLAIEQFLTTQKENELASSVPVYHGGDINESRDETFRNLTKSSGKESCASDCKSIEIQTSNISFGSIKQEKKKLDYLKSYERVILYKMKFIENLTNPDLEVKHKSPGKVPTLIGSQTSISEAEFDIMKFVRRITQQEIKFFGEITDYVETSLMHIKIVSHLENKFQKDPLDFQLKKDHIIIYSTESEKIEEFKNYLKDNCYQEFVPVNDVQKFKYIESNLKKTINMLGNAIDCIRIVARSTPHMHGYNILGFGNKSNFEEIKNELTRIIDCVESIEINLNVPNISENLELIMVGIEQKRNAVVRVLNRGSTTGNISRASIKGITIALIDGRIEDQDVDVIVNSAGKDLNLSSGPLSKAISLKAGEDLQKECQSKGHLSSGQVIESKAYNLPSKCVFHCIAKRWNKSKPKESQEILAKIVHKCLEMANTNGATSIAFPPINCGYLDMPVKVSAECILGAIESFDWEAQHTLKNIKIVICDQNNLVFQGFQQILNANLSKACSSWKYAEGVKVFIIASDKENLQKAYVGLSAAILK